MLTLESALKTRVPLESQLTVGELRTILPGNFSVDPNAVYDAVNAAFKIGFRRGVRYGKRRAAAGSRS